MRAAITDGDWLVVLESPQDAFGTAGTRDARYIHAFTDRSDVDDRYDLVFRLLDQRSVSRLATEVAPGAIAGLIAPNRVVRLLHGLRLRYATSETVGRLVPTITVTPMILLRSDTGSSLRVARSEDVHFIPYKYEELPTHLQEVQAAAEHLLDRVHRQLGQQLQPSTLSDHYVDDEAFEGMPGVEQMQRKGDHFRIVTGRSTHYLLAQPTVPDCPHHDFGKSVALHCQTGDFPIINRSRNSPRLFRQYTVPSLLSRRCGCCEARTHLGRKPNQVRSSQRQKGRCVLRNRALR